MVGIDEELSVSKSAKAAIDALSTAGPNPLIVETLRHARDVAASAMTFLGEGPLNDGRDKIGIAFSILIRDLDDGGPTREKIEDARGAAEDWMKLLEAATPRSEPKVLRRPSTMRRRRR
jgi:hypothetical protein